MDSHEFRRRGKELVDFIADHMDSIRDRQPRSSVSPGFLASQLPTSAPEEPESWEAVMSDVTRYIAPGMTEWQHPNFHGFYPSGWSFASVCGEMLASGLGGVGFSWAACPVFTELERIVTDWLGRAIGLPSSFLTSDKGGGVLGGTASEVLFTTMLAARSRAISRISDSHPELSKEEIFGRLVAYHSDQTHTCGPRAGLLAMIRMRKLPSDKEQRLRGSTLAAAVAKDEAAGFFPFFCVATFGTTNTCAFDPLDELGAVTKRHDMWLHVDAAYAGTAMICPEFRPSAAEYEHVTSFNFNPHKLMLVNPQCSVVWYQDISHFVRDVSVSARFLEHEGQEAVMEYRDMQIGFGRPFRALKLWFVLRLYGLEALRERVRRNCQLAKYFADLVSKDPRFEILRVVLGLVCFRMRGPNDKTKALVQKIEKEQRLYMVCSILEQEDLLFLRFVVCSEYATEADIDRSFNIIKELTDECEERN